MYCIRFFVLFLLILPASLSLKAQEEIEYSAVIETNSLSKDEIYSKSLIWFAETFNDSRAVIEAKDREAGMIIGNGLFKYEAPSGMKYKDVHGYVEFTVKVMIKEGRAKISLSSFKHKPSHAPYSLGNITQSEDYEGRKVNNMLSAKWHQVLWDDLKSDSNLSALAFIETFKEFMSKSASDAGDW